MALHQWRDCQAWKDGGLVMSTTSNEAAKLFDATLTQYVAWYDEPSVGGIEKTLGGMLSADSNFVLGHVLSNGLELMGTAHSPALDPEFRKALDDLDSLARKASLTEREKKHVKAVGLLGDGFMNEAALVWEDILIDHPTDMMALRFAHDSYFYRGYQPQMRDSIARVFPLWKPTMPLYSYLHGMHSFGLVETLLFDEAEKVSRKGLELNPKDAWSTHSLAHVLEMTGRQDEGIAFLSSTVKDWSTCGVLACHNFWHWAIYHLEKGEFSGVVDLYDSEIGKRVKSGAFFDIVDASSLLYRLELEGINVGDRWDDFYEICRPHADDHLMAFNDIHLVMSFLGSKQKETTDKMMESLQNFVRDGKGTNHTITKIVGEALCKAFVAYDCKEYAKATDLLLPLKYEIWRIGGSDAQRDLFHLFLIHAALKSPEAKHNKMARHLLSERKARKENSPLTDRLIAKAMAEHHD